MIKILYLHLFAGLSVVSEHPGKQLIKKIIDTASEGPSGTMKSLRPKLFAPEIHRCLSFFIVNPYIKYGTSISKPFCVTLLYVQDTDSDVFTLLSINTCDNESMKLIMVLFVHAKFCKQ